MDIVTGIIQNASPTIASLIVFYVLFSKVLDNSSQSQKGSDVLIGKLVDLMGSLKTSIDELRNSIDKRNDLIAGQNSTLIRIEEKLDNLLEDNAKSRI